MPELDLAHLCLLAGTGVVVGAINAIAGAGSLITFPLLVAFGLTPTIANVTNCVGVWAGNFSAAATLRGELRGQWPLFRQLVPVVVTGSLVGAVLLLILPSQVFDFIAPLLLAIGALLTLSQPWLSKWVARRGGSAQGGPVFTVLLSLVSAYGGYFGSGIGLLYFAILNLWYARVDVHRLNATKTVLQGLANASAAALFCVFARVQWPAAIVLMASGLIGGPLGALLARRIPAVPLRMGIGICGLAGAVLMATHTL